MPNGHEEGFILGSYYPKGKAPEIDGDIYCHAFKDGTYIEYNRKEHRLFASCVGDVEITAQNNMKINADNVSIKAQGIINLLASQIIAQEG